MSNFTIQLGGVLNSPDVVFRILDLPSELVLAILSFMDRSEVLLFSLTCKVAHNFVFGKDPEEENPRESLGEECVRILRNGSFATPTPFAQQFAFLTQLSRDLPYTFVCERCRKLHSHRSLLWYGDGDGADQPIMSHCYPDPQRKGLMTFGPLWPQHAFTWDAAYDAMMIRLNSSHVLPIPQLSLSTDWKLARLGASCNNPGFIHGYVKLDTEAVFAKDKLFLHKTQRVIVQPDRLLEFLERSLAPMEQVLRPCPHAESLGRMFAQLFAVDVLDDLRGRNTAVYDAVAQVLRAVVRTRDAGESFYTYYGWTPRSATETEETAAVEALLYPNGLPMSGCRACITDFLLTVHNHGRGGVEVVLDAYQDLGDCGSTHPGKVGDRNWILGCGGGGGSSSPDDRLDFDSVRERRQAYPAVDIDMFPTRPGRSALEHLTAPFAVDVFHLGDYERKARLARTTRTTRP
ncbi:hypothetical protein F4821DRAFT_224187 [Hypoxylon rubiginosum]|uniref:Uncharacterized protein n=1 Tax=Hypoxylon rubiginosum TaxID=110542 RepID=A0ACC0DIA3_9PEZI|nr:hypothetical protein F4821DRAFT_224187 [Hypoxylon rubiginosum]